MADISLQIITPDRVVYKSIVDKVTVPVSNGEATILPNHRSYIASLKIGEIISVNNGQENSIAVAGGFLEFSNNNLIILADEAERAEEIDLKKAERARKRAEELKEQVMRSDEIEYSRAAIALEKEISKIRVAKKYIARRGLQ